MSEPKCVRCDDRAKTIDNITETTFWGLVQTSTETATNKRVRVAGSYIRGHGPDMRVIRTDDEKPLCDPCWSLLVGQFLQGREVAPVNHEHQWKRAGRIGPYPRELCSLCQHDRIATDDDGGE